MRDFFSVHLYNIDIFVVPFQLHVIFFFFVCWNKYDIFSSGFAAVLFAFNINKFMFMLNVEQT